MGREGRISERGRKVREEGKGRGRRRGAREMKGEERRRESGTISTDPGLLSSSWFNKDEVDVGQTQGSSDKFTRVMELPQ